MNSKPDCFNKHVSFYIKKTFLDIKAAMAKLNVDWLQVMLLAKHPLA
jgi:hypothetical protein